MAFVKKIPKNLSGNLRSCYPVFRQNLDESLHGLTKFRWVQVANFLNCVIFGYMGAHFKFSLAGELPVVGNTNRKTMHRENSKYPRYISND